MSFFSELRFYAPQIKVASSASHYPMSLARLAPTTGKEEMYIGVSAATVRLRERVTGILALAAGRAFAGLSYASPWDLYPAKHPEEREGLVRRVRSALLEASRKARRESAQ